MPYYVYVLVCENGTFYTGYTRNVEVRFRLHKKGKGAKYVRTHPPEKVVYVEKFETRSDAMKRERQIKRLTHAEKQKLINSKVQKRKRKSS
jgi:putative endonuclease